MDVFPTPSSPISTTLLVVGSTLLSDSLLSDMMEKQKGDLQGGTVLGWHNGARPIPRAWIWARLNFTHAQNQVYSRDATCQWLYKDKNSLTHKLRNITSM